MPRNYVRASTGHMQPRVKGHAPTDSTFQTIAIFFDDADPAATRAALAEARLAFLDPTVHVWAWRPGMPADVPEIGCLRSLSEVLQPGQVTATRGHSTGLVGEKGKAA